MSRGERSVSDLINGLRNNKQTVHHATHFSFHSKKILSGFSDVVTLHVVSNWLDHRSHGTMK